MNVTELTWPQPADPGEIARGYQEGSRALMVARAARRVFDWDMDLAGETFIPYILTQAVPGKISGSTRFIEASYVTLYRMTGPDTMEEIVSTPFMAPPARDLAELLLTPAQEVGQAMIAAIKTVRPIPIWFLKR